jgi:O-antigen/teichoic acid export membrane protein
LVQLAFSIALISSVVLLPFTYFSSQKIHWGHEIAAAGSIWFVAVRLSQLSSIQRWIVRIARRREAPDEDDNSPFPH